MKVNTKLLQQKIKDSGLKMGFIAEKLGRSRQALSDKIQGKTEPFKCCETCANMQPIGEGDHICDACCSHDGSPTALVLESYIPADDYFICGGSRWTPQ